MSASMTLDKADWNAPVRVTGFVSMGDSERARLSGMGLHVGETVMKLMSAPLGDPVECLVGQQLLALDSALVSRIRVEAA